MKKLKKIFYSVFAVLMGWQGKVNADYPQPEPLYGVRETYKPEGIENIINIFSLFLGALIIPIIYAIGVKIYISKNPKKDISKAKSNRNILLFISVGVFIMDCLIYNLGISWEKEPYETFLWSLEVFIVILDIIICIGNPIIISINDYLKPRAKKEEKLEEIQNKFIKKIILITVPLGIINFIVCKIFASENMIFLYCIIGWSAMWLIGVPLVYDKMFPNEKDNKNE